MNEIYAKFYDLLEIGDNYPTIVMGVLNLSPESFYKGSLYKNAKKIESVVSNIIENGVTGLDPRTKVKLFLILIFIIFISSINSTI